MEVHVRPEEGRAMESNSSLKPIWFVHGAWGDVFSAIGNAMKHPEWTGKDESFLHYGWDSGVADFVSAQEFCGECVHVKPRSPDEYRKSVVDLCIRISPREVYDVMLGALIAATGIKPGQLRLVHVNEQNKRSGELNHWHNPKLPSWCEKSAAAFFVNDGRPSFLLHPYSLQSNPLSLHWPHWMEAMRWLAKTFRNCRFYVTGQGWNLRTPEGGNIECLVGKTTSNLSVLALANLCDGVITTTNNLSHWSIMANKPTVSCCVQCMSVPWYYFRRWVLFPPNRMVENRENLEVFKVNCIGMFEDATTRRERKRNEKGDNEVPVTRGAEEVRQV